MKLISVTRISKINSPRGFPSLIVMMIYTYLVSVEPVVPLVDVVLLHVLVLPDPDPVTLQRLVVDLDLPAGLDALRLKW